MAEFGDLPHNDHAGRLRDRSRVRTTPELVADVRDVPVNRVPADTSFSATSLAQPVRDKRQYLALRGRQQHDGESAGGGGRSHAPDGRPPWAPLDDLGGC